MMELKSVAFREEEKIPEVYTCEGEDVSPPLSWSDIPDGTKGYALIVDDPDAPKGTFVHWVMFNIPAVTTSFDSNIEKEKTLPTGIVQGQNDFGKIGYGGPCPPGSEEHRYYFKLYALDAPVDLPPGSSKADLEGAMKGHVLAEARLMGRYQKSG